MFALAGCAAVAGVGPAAAYQMDFDFEETFLARVAPVTTPVGSAGPYVDPDAAHGRSNGDFQLSLKGHFDSGLIENVAGGQSVIADATVFSSNRYDTVLLGGLKLTKLADGDFTIQAQLRYLITPAGRLVDIFDATTISAHLIGATGTATSNGLAQYGAYLLYGEKLTDLYGTAALNPAGTIDEYYASPEYLRYGADVANGATPFPGTDTLDGGTLTLYSPDFVPPDAGGPTAPPGAVPEPSTWAMMIGGFGMIGGAMRRRKGQLVAS